MDHFKAFPKIWHLGDRHVKTIFDSEVEITEKVDGSQFAFMNDGGKLRVRSKGQEIYEGGIPSMFSCAFEIVRKLDLPEGYIFYAEYLSKPKHNVLKYDRTPKNFLALFGVFNPEKQAFGVDGDSLEHWAAQLGIDHVPVLFRGKINSVEEIQAFVTRESYLGGPNAEGVVVKNYSQPYMLGGDTGIFIPVMSGKFVTEKFKEVANSSWKKDHTDRGNWDAWKTGFKTEARWQKAVQHLRDDNKLTGSPKDIGPLIHEVKRDIQEECKDMILAKLWEFFGKDLLRTSTNGLPEWYKQQLLESQFEDEPSNPVSS